MMFFLYFRTSITGLLQVRSQKHIQNGGEGTVYCRKREGDWKF